MFIYQAEGSTSFSSLPSLPEVATYLENGITPNVNIYFAFDTFKIIGMFDLIRVIHNQNGITPNVNICLHLTFKDKLDND
ncbi:hypothetical protein Hdeb2414_s0008g00277591 [Helianthus debilis subsp. tardiflorus]